MFACVCMSCLYLLQRAVTVGQIQSLQTVWVTQEAVQVLRWKQKHQHQTLQELQKNSLYSCLSSIYNSVQVLELDMTWGGAGRLRTGRSSPLSEFPDRSRCMRAEETAGLAQRAWQRLFTPARNDKHSPENIIQDNNEALLNVFFFSLCPPLGDMEVLERFRCFRPMGSLASWALRAETPAESDTHPAIEDIRPYGADGLQHGHQGAHDFTWKPSELTE